VPALIRGADTILEYPMVDQDPLPRWTHGRLTLLGDAAHPMVPRGSNGAGQAIIDARCLAGRLKKDGVGPAALESYDQRARARHGRRRAHEPAARRPMRSCARCYERSGGKPFARIDDIVPHGRTAGDLGQLQARGRLRPGRAEGARFVPLTADPADTLTYKNGDPPMRLFTRALTALLVSATAMAAHAWPDQPITLVVPYTPGTGIDLVARQLSARLPALLGQPVIVDNVAGASGNIGSEKVARAKPDGYTLMVQVNTLVMNRSLYKSLSYDPVADFAPVSLTSWGSLLLVTNPNVQKASTVAQMVSAAKASPRARCTWCSVILRTSAWLVSMWARSSMAAWSPRLARTALRILACSS
jgi:hypothetical protein